MAGVRQLGWKAIPAVRSEYGADTLPDRYCSDGRCRSVRTAVHHARRRDRYRRTRNFSFRDRLHEALFPLCYCPPPPDRHHRSCTTCVFRSIRSRIGIEVRSAIRIHSINRELNFFYRFLTRFFAAFHYRGIFPQ